MVSGCYYPIILLLGFAVPHRSQSPFHQKHRLFLGMVSISEICEAAGWASQSTFVRFYNLDVPALQARVPSYGFTWSTLLKPLIHLVYPYYMDARYQLMGPHPGYGWPYGSACAWCISWLPWALLPRESWCWVILGHSTEWLYLFLYKRFWRSTSEISKGNVVVTIVTSVPWDMEWVLGSWPCNELHSSVASFEEIWDAAVKRLFI